MLTQIIPQLAISGLAWYNSCMPYNFAEKSDYDLKLFFTVINNLEHKASLMGVNGPLKFSDTPKGVSRDEQKFRSFAIGCKNVLYFL